MKSKGDKRPGSKFLEKAFIGAFFNPDKELLPKQVLEKIKPINYEEHTVQMGLIGLSGWYMGHDHSDKVILFFHGSTGTNRSWIPLFKFLMKAGYRIWSFDYAGYGKSTGVTHFSAFRYDIIKIFDYVRRMEEIGIDRFTLMAHSLGCFAAQILIEEVGFPEKCVLQSPIYSLPRLLKGKIPGFLMKYLGLSDFTLEKIYRSYLPLQVLIGGNDTLIGREFGADFWRERPQTTVVEISDYKHADFVIPKPEKLKNIF